MSDTRFFIVSPTRREATWRGLCAILVILGVVAPVPAALAHGGAGGTVGNTVSFSSPTGFRVTLPAGASFGLPPLVTVTEPTGIRISFGGPSRSSVVTLPTGAVTQSVSLPGGLQLPLPVGSSAQQPTSNTVVLNLPGGTSVTLPWPQLQLSPPVVQTSGNITLTFPGVHSTVGLPAGSQVFLPPLSTSSFPTTPTVGLSFGLENQGNTVVMLPGADLHAGVVPPFQLHPPGTWYGLHFPSALPQPRPGGPSASDARIRVVAGKGSGIRLTLPSPITLRPSGEGEDIAATMALQTVLRFPKGALGQASATSPAVVSWMRARAPQLLVGSRPVVHDEGSPGRER